MRLLAKSRKKYHKSIIKNHRSIIKDNTKHAKIQFKRFKYRKESKKILPKNESDVWALVARFMGSGCPAQGLQMPTWWATDARVTGTGRPTEGHKGTI